ncbi:hypothetical protein CDD83_9914 [Cordyceps sp. RAO-2017]|nr:hypothetical protein CDD83_9914 [Cordyceps sp. RAO-2017]
MDDPDWAWPAWKFGMRKDDLFTTLHDRYNTFTFTLQDPEAFHHDVYEISRDADTAEQFHRLLAGRQQQRLRELNDSLETLAVEIVGNPKLVGSDQWQHAVQLFRTRSYDSIVRYFASYLPDHYFDRHDAQSLTSCSSFSETDSVSTKASSTDDGHCPLFLDDDLFPDGPIVTVEPCAMDDDGHEGCCAEDPSSPPRSEALSSASSASSPSDVESPSRSSTNPPSRSMSFSGSESGHMVSGLMRRRQLHAHADDHATGCLEDREIVDLTACDADEKRAARDDVIETPDTTSQSCASLYSEDDDEFLTAQYPDDQFDCLDAINPVNDTLESDTPTPRQEMNAAAACCYLDHKRLVAPRPSPTPMSRQRMPSPKLYPTHREARSASRDVRRSPEEALSRIRRPTQYPVRKRPRGRRRLD